MTEDQQADLGALAEDEDFAYLYFPEAAMLRVGDFGLAIYGSGILPTETGEETATGTGDGEWTPTGTGDDEWPTGTGFTGTGTGTGSETGSETESETGSETESETETETEPAPECPDDECPTCAECYCFAFGGISTCGVTIPAGVIQWERDEHAGCLWQTAYQQFFDDGDLETNTDPLDCEDGKWTVGFGFAYHEPPPMKTGNAIYEKAGEGPGDCPDGVYWKTYSECGQGEDTWPATITIYACECLP